MKSVLKKTFIIGLTSIMMFSITGSVEIKAKYNASGFVEKTSKSVAEQLNKSREIPEIITRNETIIKSKTPMMETSSTLIKPAATLTTYRKNTIKGTDFIFSDNGLKVDGIDTEYNEGSILTSDGDMRLRLNNVNIPAKILSVQVQKTKTLFLSGQSNATLAVNKNNDPSISIGVSAGYIHLDNYGDNIILDSIGADIGIAATCDSYIADYDDSFQLQSGRFYGTGSQIGISAADNIMAYNVQSFVGTATNKTTPGIAGIVSVKGKITLQANRTNNYQMHIWGRASGENTVGVWTMNGSSGGHYDILAQNKKGNTPYVSITGYVDGKNSMGIVSGKSILTKGNYANITGHAEGENAVGGFAGRDSNKFDTQQVLNSGNYSTMTFEAIGSNSVGLKSASYIEANDMSTLVASGEYAGMQSNVKYSKIKGILTICGISQIIGQATNGLYGIQALNGGYIHGAASGSVIMGLATDYTPTTSAIMAKNIESWFGSTLVEQYTNASLTLDKNKPIAPFRNIKNYSRYSFVNQDKNQVFQGKDKNGIIAKTDEIYPSVLIAERGAKNVIGDPVYLSIGSDHHIIIVINKER